MMIMLFQNYLRVAYFTFNFKNDIIIIIFNFDDKKIHTKLIG